MEIQNSPEIVPKIAEITEIVEVWDRDANGSKTGFTRLPRALSAAGKDIKRRGGFRSCPCVPRITTAFKIEAQRIKDRQCTTKATSSTGLHEKTTIRYMMLAMQIMNPLHEPHSQQET